MNTFIKDIWEEIRGRILYVLTALFITVLAMLVTYYRGKRDYKE
jgi:hypothetical protein